LFLEGGKGIDKKWMMENPRIQEFPKLFAHFLRVVQAIFSCIGRKIEDAVLVCVVYFGISAFV
jgi:hypothetical protein